MTEEEKKQSTDGSWQHDQQVNFRKFVPHLEVLKLAIQKQINHEKAKLAQMVGARDSIQRKK
jgi:hypothetical protein